MLNQTGGCKVNCVTQIIYILDTVDGQREI